MKNQRNIFLVSMLFIAGTTDAAGGENQQDGFFPPEVYMSNILFTLVEDQSVEDKRLDTVLGEAVRHLNYKKVNQLLDMTSAIDEVNNFGESALMIAASNGDIEMLELLLQRGANINLSTNCKGTALSQAARHNKLNSVRFLLNHGAMVDKGADFFNNMTPLQEAVRHGNVSIIEELLKRGVNPNVQEGFCKTFPLKNAVIFGHFASVLALLNGGANINAGCGFLNETALHEVAKRGKVDLAIILLKYKANPFLT
ncbi:ankyrin repeat domain-containing protein, partial [Candidatus Babeliales bacterium]|nr:ankyrin repeat domain-containing protein [Candidatus Babeliales bacterium]